MMYYDAQHPKYRPAENPLNLEMQMLSSAVEPTDLNGTATLVWRYRDPNKPDKGRSPECAFWNLCLWGPFLPGTTTAASA
ncbi:MAG TPA: hypothetical protein VF515_17055 [Candidatus Binatia bacterium]|jgi:hypothetical protein